MDRETVITHLQIIHTWALFARERDLQFFSAKHLEDIAQWSDDALALLKEQEADMIALKNAYKELAEKGSVIVRCKDCKHYDGDGTCMKIGIAMLTDDWFCADGERRTDDA